MRLAVIVSSLALALAAPLLAQPAEGGPQPVATFENREMSTGDLSDKLSEGGSKIKAIGAAARAELMEVLGVKVHLYLHVKVLENWAEDKEVFEEIGLDWVR